MSDVRARLREWYGVEDASIVSVETAKDGAYETAGERHDRDDGTAAVYYPVADLVRVGCVRESWAAPYTGWV